MVDHFRCSPINRHAHHSSTCLKRANNRHGRLASLALWIVRGIDKNCARRSLELQLHDGFFAQGPYEMRLTRRNYGECSVLSNFRIGSVEFFTLAVINLAAEDCRIFSVWMPMRRSLSIWWEFKTQYYCPRLGRIAVQYRRLSSRYEGNVEPFQLVFVNRI